MNRIASLLIAASSLCMWPAVAQLPTLGDTSEMTSGAERKLGERIARELYRDPDYIDDPVLAEYVQSLWQPLLAAARVRGDLTAELDERFAWRVLLGKDRSINAFALPGGWLGLHLGLIIVTANRDELASVLAHELSHVTQRHISRLITQEKRQTPLVIAAMILGALAASKSPEAANAVVAGSQALAIQNQLNFSRDMEREADRIGYGVLTQAGFEPQGFVSMFDKLQQASRLNDNGAFPYLRTHPMTTERMADMQSRQQLNARSSPAGAAASAPAVAAAAATATTAASATAAGPASASAAASAAAAAAAGAASSPGLEHALMVARARVVSNPGVDALRGLLTEADAPVAGQSRARQAGALYAAALASARLRDNAGAARWLARLTTATAGDAKAARLANLLAAELALIAGDAARAAALVDLAAAGRPELLLSAQARIQWGRAADAAQRLQTWVALNPRDATAWQLLATAYTAQGQALRAIRAEAEAQVATLDYAAAADRFKAAQELVRKGAAGGDHIEASIIDTRARQVESLLREQALER